MGEFVSRGEHERPMRVFTFYDLEVGADLARIESIRRAMIACGYPV